MLNNYIVLYDWRFLAGYRFTGYTAVGILMLGSGGGSSI